MGAVIVLHEFSFLGFGVVVSRYSIREMGIVGPGLGRCALHMVLARVDMIGQ